jgi:hypothetical protein
VALPLSRASLIVLIGFTCYLTCCLLSIAAVSEGAMSYWSSTCRLAGEVGLPSGVGCRVWLEKASSSKCYTLSVSSAEG